MKKLFKNVVSAMLALVITVTCLPVDSQEIEIETDGVQFKNDFLSKNNMIINGTDTLGNMLAEELSAKSDEQTENNGYNIFSVEIEEGIAKVSFETLQNSSLLVALYDNEGSEMIVSGYTNVTAEETEAIVEIDSENIPEYFYIRAYLINPETLRPLSLEYSSPMYTQKMQDFLSKNVNDFDSDRVINLDENEDTNFAVFREDTKIIPESSEVNIVISANDETLTYVFGNIDENITSLKSGDFFAYNYQDNLLIVKVNTVSINGKTATVIGQDMELEEVFEHLRIDGEAFSQDAKVDTSDLEEGITYEGLVTDDESGVAPYSIDIEGKASYSHKFSFEKKGEEESGTTKTSYSFFAGLDIKLETSAKVYVSFSEIYVQLKLDYSAKLKAEFDGKVSKSFPLAYFAISPVPGVYISLTPSFIVEFDGKASIDVRLYGTVGFKASTKGMENLTTTPKLELNGEIKVTVFIGLSLEPKISIISEKIANASLTAKAGGEIKAELKKSTNEKDDVRHECEICFDGDVNAKFSLSASVKLLNKDKWKFSISVLDKSIHLFDFYISHTYSEFGFGECPHISYLTDITVYNTSAEKLKGVKIFVDENASKIFVTNDNGIAQIWLSAGEHSFKIEAEGYKSKTKTEKIGVKEKSLKFILTAEKELTAFDLFSGMFDQIADGMVNPNKVKDVEIAIYHSAAITADNSLYMWGSNQLGQLGDGTWEDREFPVKVMDNVASVYLGDVIGDIDEHSAAITTDGELYMWGYNKFGELGDGTKESHEFPIKIMDNVAHVSLGGTATAAITKYGELYTWGENEHGDLGDGSWENKYFPVKIMENVAYVTSGGAIAAITTDGSLYTWGYNDHGILGNGTDSQDSNVPQKIMDNVSNVVTRYCTSAAITTDGSLYMWGENDYGQLGNGTTQDSYVPIKIMDNIASVSLDGETTAAVTKDGEVYMWGYNRDGVLGNGKDEWNLKNSCNPIKIMDNVVSTCTLYGRSYAITSDHSLYAWGSSGFGSMLSHSSTVPIKIMDNIATAKFTSMTSVALTTDGKLYMCGHNGFYNTIDTPTIIKFDPSNGAAEICANTLAIQALSEEDITVNSLIPNEVYNYYAVNDKIANDILSPDNLVYIGQSVTDSEGVLTVPSYASEGTVFVKAMKEFDVCNAEIISTETTEDSVTVKWNPVENADEYEVYCFTQNGIISIIKTTDSSATFNNLNEDTYYGFLVTSTVHGEKSVPAINDVKTVYIPAVECSHKNTEIETTPSTCLIKGKEEIVCKDCGEIIDTKELELAEHVWDEGEITKEPTCTEDGEKTLTCLVCGETITETVDAVGHKTGESTVTKEPTCTAEGQKASRCENCGEVFTETIPATGHTFGEWEIDKEATCTEEGYRSHSCINCTESETEPIPPTDHTFGEWIIDKEATCTEEGYKSHSCINCTESETEPIPAAGHTFGEWITVKEATETESGIEERECSACGKKGTREIAAKGESEAPKPSTDDNTVTTTPEGNTNKPADDNTTSPDTGVASVTVVAGIAAIAAAAVVIAKKRK